MPSFTNNTKITNKAIEKACGQLLLAAMLEATYQDSQWGDNWYDCRESMINDLMNDAVDEIVPEEYEEFRDTYHGDLDHMDEGYSIYSHHNY